MLTVLGRKRPARGRAWLRSAYGAFHAVRLMPGLVEPHPRRKDAGMGPAHLGTGEIRS